MVKNKISNVRTRGAGTLEKIISYRTERNGYQEIRIKAEFEGEPAAEKVKQISEIIEKAAIEMIAVIKSE